ncbi:unnamed protein product, partial [Symbiodinium microadriaticum]
HSLHLLPSCVEELVRVLPAAQQEQADPDAVFARNLSLLTPYSLDLLLHGWQPHVFGVVAPAVVRKTAVLRFLALPPAAQLVLLDRLAHPVYKYTRPLKVRGRLHPDEDGDWPSDALYETGSDTEGSAAAGDLAPVNYSGEFVMRRSYRQAGSATEPSDHEDEPLAPPAQGADEVLEVEFVGEEPQEARVEAPDCRSNLNRLIADAVLRRSVSLRRRKAVLRDSEVSIVLHEMELTTSRGSRELGANRLFTGWPQRLQAFSGREDGHLYFSQGELHQCPTAAWLLSSVSNLESAYARLQLLFTPSTFQAWDESLRIHYRPTSFTLNDGVDCKDGQSEVGPEAAVRLGLLSDTRSAARNPLGAALQYRGLVYCSQMDETMLVKGMLVINDRLGSRVYLSESCVKARAPGRRELPYGLDVVHKTSTKRVPAVLTPSLVAVLRLRVASIADAAERATVDGSLDDLIRAAKSHTEQSLATNAWELPARSLEPAGHPLRESAGEDDFWHTARAPSCAVQMSAGALEEDEAPTPLAELQLERREAWPVLQDTPQCALRGTKTAAALGLTFVISDYEKCHSPAVSGGVRVISDPYFQDATRALARDHCYLVFNGKAYAGDVAVWRYPEHTITDTRVLTAELPPAGMILHDNCMVMSCDGKVNSEMAGGDMDGDDIFFTFWRLLIAFLRATQEVLADFEKPDTSFKSAGIAGRGSDPPTML